jgi:predicted transcriptional regulator
MAERLDPKEVVTFRELLMSITIEQEALVNLLEKKGILTKDELLEEIKRLKATIPQVRE